MLGSFGSPKGVWLHLSYMPPQEEVDSLWR